MRRRHIILTVLAVTATVTRALGGQVEDTPTAEELIKAMDANLTAKTQILTSRMVVHGRRSSRTIVSKSWIVGTDKAFTEYLAPPREAGTKMLKVGNQLRTYSPQTDRIIRISGHMLRQSLMGSDLSYQDMMEDQEFLSAYEGVVEGSELLNGRDSWILILTARETGLAYPLRQAWVGREESEAADTKSVGMMMEAIAGGGAGFSNLQQMTIAGHDVFRVDGPGGEHIFYISREQPDRVVWLTVNAADVLPILETAIKIF